MSEPITATLLVSCRDRAGLVAALSDFVFRHGGNIFDADQHAERESGQFFMRLTWDLGGFALAGAALRAAIENLERRFDLTWELTTSEVRPRVALFVSKAPHCLYDLLQCHQLGEMGGDIVQVIGDHRDPAAGVCRHFDVPFVHIGVDPRNKIAAEQRQLAVLDELRVDLVVLARYMQILSPAFVARWPGRIINIHHSFLPAFVGARPYHQAVRDARRFLKISQEILARPDSALWIPAGARFSDPRERPVQVRSGVGHLASRVRSAVLLPLALEMPFWGAAAGGPGALRRGDPDRGRRSPRQRLDDGPGGRPGGDARSARLRVARPRPEPLRGPARQRS